MDGPYLDFRGAEVPVALAYLPRVLAEYRPVLYRALALHFLGKRALCLLLLVFCVRARRRDLRRLERGLLQLAQLGALQSLLLTLTLFLRHDFLRLLGRGFLLCCRLLS